MAVGTLPTLWSEMCRHLGVNYRVVRLCVVQLVL